VKEYFTQINSFNEQLLAAQEQILSFNQREELFKQQKSEYDELMFLQKEFEPYFKIWDIAMNFDLSQQDWCNGPFLKLSFAEVEKRLDQYFRDTIKLQKLFTDMEAEDALKVASDLKELVQSFKLKSWIIELLTKDAFVKKPIYWKEIFTKLEISSIEFSEEMSFNQLLNEARLGEHRDYLTDLSSRAEKQYGLEKKLNEMVDHLKDIKLQTLSYKKTGTFVLMGIDEV